MPPVALPVLVAALLVLCPLAASAGEAADSVPQRRWGAVITVTPGSAIVMDSYQRQWQQGKRNMALSLKVSHTALPEDSDAYAADYGYPTLSLGVKYSLNHRVTMRRTDDWGEARRVDYTSRMGNVVSLVGSFERTLFRTRRWAASYEMSVGAAYSHRKYNPHNNVDDELIGSRFLIHFGAALYAAYHFSDCWALKGGIEYYHYSNGALNRPNKGANFFGPVVGVAYEPYWRDVADRRHLFVPQRFRPYWYALVDLGVGGKTLDEDWQQTQFNTPEGEPRYRTGRFHFYTAYSLRAAIMRRYARRWASGIGVDTYYGSYSDHIAGLDRQADHEERHSPWSLGISARHEVFYHRLSMSMSLGWYVYRHMGHAARDMETPYYEHIGLRYTTPWLGGLQVGAEVKAHRTKADLTQLLIALPIRL